MPTAHTRQNTIEQYIPNLPFDADFFDILDALDGYDGDPAALF